jgi:hypothetical protein
VKLSSGLEKFRSRLRNFSGHRKTSQAREKLPRPLEKFFGAPLNSAGRQKSLAGPAPNFSAGGKVFPLTWRTSPVTREIFLLTGKVRGPPEMFCSRLRNFSAHRENFSGARETFPVAGRVSQSSAKLRRSPEEFGGWHAKLRRRLERLPAGWPNFSGDVETFAADRESSSAA